MSHLLIDAYAGQGACEGTPAKLRKLRQQLKVDLEAGTTQIATLDKHAQQF
jgi:hypothetical protein